MYDTLYHCPTRLEDVEQLLVESEDILCLAGGMTLIPSLKQRLMMPDALVDLAKVLSRTIRLEDAHLVVGAGARHVDVARSELVQRHIPALAALAGGIGDPMVRNRGTLGGSLANNDPAADYPAALLALRGEVVTNRRRLSAPSFLTGMFETALEQGEVITEVRFAIPKAAAYHKCRQGASGFALAGVFLTRFANGVDSGVTGVASQAYQDPDMIAALQAASLADWQPDDDDFLSDMHADLPYRTALLKHAASAAWRAITPT